MAANPIASIVIVDAATVRVDRHPDPPVGDVAVRMQHGAHEVLVCGRLVDLVEWLGNVREAIIGMIPDNNNKVEHP